jgi:hypothetical protein
VYRARVQRAVEVVRNEPHISDYGRFRMVIPKSPQAKDKSHPNVAIASSILIRTHLFPKLSMGDSPDGFVADAGAVVRANKRQRRCAKACKF